MDFGGPEQELRYKHYIISLLVRQASVDGRMAQEEVHFILHVAKKLDLPLEAIEPILKKPLRFHMEPPADEHLRMQALYYLLFMMRADGDISPEEEMMCYKVGFQLGFRMEMIHNLVSLMRQFLRQKLPPDAMLQAIKPYLN